jgi:hypothetical protein
VTSNKHIFLDLCFVRLNKGSVSIRPSSSGRRDLISRCLIPMVWKSMKIHSTYRLDVKLWRQQSAFSNLRQGIQTLHKWKKGGKSNYIIPQEHILGGNEPLWEARTPLVHVAHFWSLLFGMPGKGPERCPLILLHASFLLHHFTVNLYIDH